MIINRESTHMFELFALLCQADWIIVQIIALSIMQ